jgi:hypothetical protein
MYQGCSKDVVRLVTNFVMLLICGDTGNQVTRQLQGLKFYPDKEVVVVRDALTCMVTLVTHAARSALAW